MAKRRFSLIGHTHPPVVATTTQLEDIGDAINLSDNKVEGYRVFNTTTNKQVWSAGDADNALWLDHAGVTAHTPV